MNRLILSAVAALAIGLAGCGTPGHRAEPGAPAAPQAKPGVATPQATYRRVDWATLSGWSADDVEALAPAIRRQCARLGAPANGAAGGTTGAAAPALPASGVDPADARARRDAALRAQWPRLCAELDARPNGQPLRAWIERHFEPWALGEAADNAAPREEGLITGYYEPLLRGARAVRGPYATPLYRRPPDLLTIDLAAVAPETRNLRLRGRLEGQKVVPYRDRRAIETRAPLAGHELLWVDDAVEAFFLHIQGSGRVRLDDGSWVRIAYADQNGHPYVPLGRVLVERGLIARGEATAPAIKNWLRANPAQAAELMRENPSYVFFSEERLVPEADGSVPGPKGALGVPLTEGRSIAVDPRFVPLGALAFVDTPHPQGNGRVTRAVAAQDTGGAIRGAVRADMFWGAGAQAERMAGLMRSNGRLWLLWPRQAPAPGSQASPGA